MSSGEKTQSSSRSQRHSIFPRLSSRIWSLLGFTPHKYRDYFARVDKSDAFDFLYSSPSLEVLNHRRKDPMLSAQVHKSLSLSEPLSRALKEPRAILFRHVATPMQDILNFISLAGQLGIKPLILEYTGDKFSPRNPYKNALGKLLFYKYTGSDGVDAVEHKTIMDFNAYIGKPLNSVLTMHGEPLVAFHHQLFERVTGLSVAEHVLDVTDWLRAQGSSYEYYNAIFHICVRDAILFENFDPTPDESAFVHSIIIPAFQNVTVECGQKPLIVRLVPPGEELRRFWYTYPMTARAAMLDIQR